MQHPSMRVRFWGVRGSIACPGPETIRYGGNTPCIEVHCGEHVLIFDAGTGLRALGQRAGQGFERFATSIFSSRTAISITSSACRSSRRFSPRAIASAFGPAILCRPKSIEQVMRKLMSSPLFPVEVEIFKAKIEYHDFSSGDVLRPYDDVTLQTGAARSSRRRQRLPPRTWRTHIRACSATPKDFPANAIANWSSLARDADLIVYDGTFTEKEIAIAAGWGHSTYARGIRLADEAKAKQLCLFHHDPSHDDDFMDALAADANDARPGTITAREGQIVDL